MPDVAPRSGRRDLCARRCPAPPLTTEGMTKSERRSQCRKSLVAAGDQRKEVRR